MLVKEAIKNLVPVSVRGNISTFLLWEGIVEVEISATEIDWINPNGKVPGYWLFKLGFKKGGHMNVHIHEPFEAETDDRRMMRAEVKARQMKSTDSNVAHHMLYLNLRPCKETKPDVDIQISRKRNKRLEGPYWTSGNSRHPATIHLVPLKTQPE